MSLSWLPNLLRSRRFRPIQCYSRRELLQAFVIDKILSQSIELLDFTGTPITGSGDIDATIPGR
jgi:hypothetical protein